MKGIKLCGECGNYDYKKHRCRIGCKDDSDAQAPFYCDCPLPDVVPKSEVERLEKEVDRLSQVVLYNDGVTQMLVEEAKEKVVREIFEEINTIKKEYASGDIDGNELYVRLYMLEKKYTEEKK